jgi:hypothetical protein
VLRDCAYITGCCYYYYVVIVVIVIVVVVSFRRSFLPGTFLLNQR